jgi:hypothetical protein
MIPELFENEKDWIKEWQDMPEFIQSKTEKEYHKVTIRFANKEDLESFAKLIDQTITNKTKAIWYPKIERGLNANKLYINES